MNSYVYMHICSAITDAANAKQLETDLDSLRQKADEADALRKELLELKKSQNIHALKVYTI